MAEKGPSPAADLAALLLATGRFNATEVASRSGLSLTRLSTLRSSPLFKVLLAGYRKRMSDSVIEQVLADVLNEAPNTFSTIKALQDGQFDDAKTAGVQLAAAKVLFDRQLPKVEKTEQSVNITIERKLVERLEAGMVEDGVSPAIDISPVSDTTLKTVADLAAEEAALPPDED